MTSSLFSEKHKIASADIFEATTYNTPDNRKSILEEKKFDQEGRLIERRFVYKNKTPKMIERYDYEIGVVHKSFYERRRQILRFTLPLYSEQELRTKYTPIKERIQLLGFAPEQIIKVYAYIKSTDKFGEIEQETWHNCDSFSKKNGITSVKNTVYDEHGNKCISEEYNSYHKKNYIDYSIFDAQGNNIFYGSGFDTNTIERIDIFLFYKNQKIKHITNITIPYSNNGISVTHYPYKRNKKVYDEICSTVEYDEDEEYFTPDDPEEDTITILDPTGRVLKETVIYYEENEKGEKIKERTHEKEYTYNESGVLIKETENYVYHNGFFCAGSYYSETILYNEQGQKIEYIEKHGDKESLEAIGEDLNLKFPIKDKIYLRKSLYYYNEQGDLIREDFRKWTLNEGIETDIETLSTLHFYEKEEGYEAHLEVTVKTK
jgi:hypothetical protein